MYADMTQVLTPAVSGLAALEHFEVSATESQFSYFQGGGVPQGRYVRLYVGGKLMMSDTPMERRSNAGFVNRATGDVLVAGLGIGLILLPVLRRESVLSVTVVEKYTDVIDLIAPQLKAALTEQEFAKLQIEQSDIFDFKPAKGLKFDCIYFDIWPDKCTDNLKEIAALHIRYKGRLKGNRFMDSWCKEELKYRLAQERRSRW